jgi:lactate permease
VFHQILTPVGNSLPLSFMLATLPMVTVLVTLGIARRPAWQASLAGLVVATLVAIGLWHFPPKLALAASANGAAFGLMPLMWIVFNAILLYNVAVTSGSFDSFRDWVLDRLPDDRRVVLVVVGFCFGALIEGVAGFGTPVAITSSLLTLMGFAPLEAIVYALIFNTAPVAFSALGVPINVLATVTHLPPSALAAMVGRQLPMFAFLLPFYVTAFYGGWRSIRALWPVLLVAAGTFAVTQFVVSNFINYALTDVLASLGSLVATLVFLRYWRPKDDARFAVARGTATIQRSPATTWRALAPWLVVSATVLVWGTFAVFSVFEIRIPWPMLQNTVAITLYGGRPYSAVWSFQPLGTGTAILAAAILTALLLRLRAWQFLDCIRQTWRETRLVTLTVAFMVALAYLMNYSGMTYTLGFGVASVGVLFVALSPLLGWIAVVLSGSDTAGNALFGNLQVVAASQLQLDPVLFAATNSSGGVMGKMVSPENIAAGSSVVQAGGGEGAVFARTFPHSLALTATLAAVVVVQQFFTPWIIPH